MSTPPEFASASSTSLATAADRVIVVGGGVAGLAAAHRVCELAPHKEVVLLEAQSRLGGVLCTERVGPYLIEHAADMFITQPADALNLCRRIGLADELLPTQAGQRRAYVARKGRLLPVPDGFTLLAPRSAWGVLRSPLLSLRGKLRLLGEWFVPPRAGEDDESLASFARRRLGREAYERLVQPLVGGIYTGDGEQLSLQATLPQFAEMERRHGGLIRAALRTRGGEKPTDSGARYGLFVAPREGMSQFIQQLAGRLPADCVRLESRVERLERAADGWRVGLANGAELAAGAVILAAPAAATANLLRPLDDELGRLLEGIEHASSVVAVTVHRTADFARPLEGVGFVVPACEGRRILAASYSSRKFAGRAPEGDVIVRTFVGGALQGELCALDDAAILALVQKELHELLGLQAAPILSRIVRWTRAMPQYAVGHVQRIAQLDERVRALPGLALAGNAYAGVGIPQCVRSGEQAAQRVLQIAPA